MFMWGEWGEYARCDHCNEIVAEKFFSSRFLMPVCPKCGEENSVHFVTARQVYKGKWYNPATWWKFGWEVKE